MDMLGNLGEMTIRSVYVIFSGTVLIQAYTDYWGWIRTYYLKSQLPAVYEIRCMAFSLLTAVVCIIGLGYLHWMLLGAWWASRRRVNEPWSALNIIQPNTRPERPVETADYYTSFPQNMSYPARRGADIVGDSGDAFDGQLAREGQVEDERPRGTASSGGYSAYYPAAPNPRQASHGGVPRYSYTGSSPFEQEHISRAPRVAPPQARRMAVPQSTTHQSRFGDMQSGHAGAHFATSLPHNFGGMHYGPSMWQEQMAGRDADGDVDMLRNRRRFH